MAPVGSVFFAVPVLADEVLLGDFAVGAGAGAAGALEDAGGVAGVVDFAAFFSTPPWPLHAPLPALDVVPSLHVTVSSAPDGAGAGEADVDPDDFVLAWVAALSTPPCPLHAPEPPFEVDPSLQMTVVGAPAARARAGTAKRSAASATNEVP
jgi:hypothetical protein